jgi:putative thioredoxin
VADLTSARSESQLRQVLDQLLAKLPVQAGADGAGAPDVSQFITMGEEVLAEGDGERAATIFAQVVEMAPDNVPAHAGLIRALVAAGQVTQAQDVLAALPAEIADDPALAQAKSALSLAENAPDDGELAGLRQAASAAPADMDAQFALANAAFAAGQRDEAADTLLTMIRVQPEWQDGGAKAKLLQIFEAVGLEDPWVAATRRKLSLILFG